MNKLLAAALASSLLLFSSSVSAASSEGFKDEVKAKLEEKSHLDKKSVEIISSADMTVSISAENEKFKEMQKKEAEKFKAEISAEQNEMILSKMNDLKSDDPEFGSVMSELQSKSKSYIESEMEKFENKQEKDFLKNGFVEEKRNVAALYVEYDLVKSTIFKSHHKEFLYYDKESKAFLDSSLFAEEAKSFESAYKDEKKYSDNYNIVLLFIFGMIAVCYYIIYVHNKDKYSREELNFVQVYHKGPKKKKKAKK